MTGLRVAVSARTYDRDVGGNSTYVRNVYRRLGLDHELLRAPGGSRPRGRALRWAAYEALALQRVARRAGCRLAHYPADTGPVRPLPGIVTVLTLHGVGTLVEPGIRRPAAASTWLARARAAARAADAVITVSESSKAGILQLAGHALAPRVHVIPHGVDLSVFRPATAEERADVRRRHAVGDRFLLFVGNLEPRKNVPALIAAAERLGDEHPGLRLVVVGRPAWDAGPTLEAMARSPRTSWLGRVCDADLRALLSLCDALVLPSRYEGFGLPVLEAMACGAPVVCTRRGSLPEVGGDAVTYADDIGPEAVADGVRRSLARPRQHWVALGRARAEMFSWEACAGRHRDLLEDLGGA